METIQFDWGNLSLPLAQATLQHVAGVDPTLRWQKRGLKSHDKNEEAGEELSRALDEANQFIRKPEGQQQLQAFMKKTYPIFNDLLRESEWFENHFEDHHFFFVVGPMRTGGTYLFKELCELFSVDWNHLNFRMVHDSIPTPEFLAYPNNALSWLPLAFEMAQYLRWVQEAYPAKNVIKKRISFAHSLKILDNWFGEHADYLVPIRHPAGIAQSGSEMLDTFHEQAPNPGEQGWNFLVQDRTEITEEQWQTLDFEEKVLKYWEVYYRDIGQQLPVDGTLRPVVFGEDSEEVIRTITEEQQIEHDPEPFTPKDRDFPGFWNSGRVEETVERVRDTWAMNGRDFPTTIPLR